MKRLFALILLFVICAPTVLHAQGWTNPMVLPGKGNGSWGDPYILKYRGYYYLYVSAGDKNIYCWQSKDLINWTEDYICCTDETTAVAYAPEVIYWNGKFYMVTSPRGGGHYMLTSDSPLGPFTHQTGNMGRDIDGSMFVDDDGRWYFYHANNAGIHACDMPTHLSFGGDINLGCCMSGQWTEGPCVFKRNNLYYLLYTGNHVWTNGYRIDYAMSNNGALSGFRPQSDQNPILIDTETPTHKALGHGTAFIGPDLDTYFFCYHNLQDNKSRRLLNFERIAWNGDKLMMTGPTNWEQDKPLVATNDYFERTEIGADWNMINGGQWQIEEQDHLSQTLTEGTHTALFEPCSYENYTAEFTVKASEISEGKCGVVFSYQDDNNYNEALISIAEKKIELIGYVEGEQKTNNVYGLPIDFDPLTWHSIRVEKTGKKVCLFIDGMRKAQILMTSTGGKIGYTTQEAKADFSYVAISPYVYGSASLEVSQPVPGMLAANLCAEKSDDVKQTSYSITTGSSNYMKCAAGSRLTYNVNIQNDNVYNIGVRYRATADATIRLLLDGEAVTDNEILPKSSLAIAVSTLRDIHLPGGHHQLTIEVVDGAPFLYEYNIKRGVADPHVMADNFDEGFNEEWGYKEGSWNIVDGQLESTGYYGKMLMGGFDDIHLTDYTVECDVIYTSGDMNGGLLFRTTNASTGGADDNPVLGTDFLQGYFFLAGGNSVALGKQNYGWQSLASANVNVDTTIPHHMKVEVIGARILCYLDDMSTPLIDYTDTKPFITGRAGFRTHNTVMRFDNFKVTPMTKDETAVRPLVYRNDTTPSAGVYNIQGQRFNEGMTFSQGLYVENGRKVLK